MQDATTTEAFLEEACELSVPNLSNQAFFAARCDAEIRPSTHHQTHRRLYRTTRAPDHGIGPARRGDDAATGESFRGIESRLILASRLSDGESS